MMQYQYCACPFDLATKFQFRSGKVWNAQQKVEKREKE